MYTWNFDDEGYWDHGEFNTIEECIENAKEERELEYDPELLDYIYVGEYIPYIPKVDCEYLLDDILDDAYNECGEGSESWEPYDYKEVEENEELNNAMTEILLSWLKKHNRMPNFGTIKNMEKVSLGD